jgi:hypothetical protein
MLPGYLSRVASNDPVKPHSWPGRGAVGKWRMHTGLSLVSLTVCIALQAGCAGRKDTRIYINEERATIGEHENIPNHKKILTFYALGDWGTGKAEQQEVAQALKKEVCQSFPMGNERDISPFVIGLGDNFYPAGLPDINWDNKNKLGNLRKKVEKTFGAMYSEVKYGPANVIFHAVPGNHDHGEMSPIDKLIYRDSTVIHQETTVESMYPWFKYYPIQHENIPSFRKKDSNNTRNTINDENNREEHENLKERSIFELALPQEIEIQGLTDVIIVALDTQIILNLYDEDRKDIVKEYVADLVRAKAYRKRLEELLSGEYKWKIVIGHHPFKSFGPHGYKGSNFFEKIYVEASEQDLGDDAYQEFIKDFRHILQSHGVDLYISGHEHNLQFLDLEGGLYQFISGSASKTSDICILDEKYYFASEYDRGFMRFDLDVVENNLWVKIFGVKNSSPILRAIFKITKDKIVTGWWYPATISAAGETACGPGNSDPHCSDKKGVHHGDCSE